MPGRCFPAAGASRAQEGQAITNDPFRRLRLQRGAAPADAGQGQPPPQTVATSSAYIEKPNAKPIAIQANAFVHLAPCPFCGLAGLEAEQPFPGELDWAVACSGCGMIGPPAASEAGALELWNRRIKTDGYIISQLGD